LIWSLLRFAARGTSGMSLRSADLGLGNHAWSFAKQNSEANASQAHWPALGARARRSAGHSRWDLLKERPLFVGKSAVQGAHAP